MVQPPTPASALPPPVPQPRLVVALQVLQALHEALASSDRMLRHSRVLIRQRAVTADEPPRS